MLALEILQAFVLDPPSDENIMLTYCLRHESSGVEDEQRNVQEIEYGLDGSECW